MDRVIRIWYNAVFGGLGGLLGWLLFGRFVGWLVDTGAIDPILDWQLVAILGGLFIGASIGYFVVSVDAILDRAAVKFLRYASVGVVLGAAGGLVGFWVGEGVNYALQPAAGETMTNGRAAGIVLARGIGWMLFGLLVGVSEGVAARSFGKFSYGAIGGTLGGFIGGAIFGWLMLADKDDAGYLYGQAIGLVVLGACIGSLTALVEEVLKPAALKVMRGWQEGREYPLVKAQSVVGRDESVDILLLRDMKVEKQHVVIHRRANRFLLMNPSSPPQNTLVNGMPTTGSVELHDGDRIQLGNVVLKFLMRAARERRKR
jgi:MFS family permease